MLRPKRLGHIVLRVLDLERSIKFYSEILGLTNTFSIANKMHFMSASGDSSHELALVSIGNEAQRLNSNMVGLSHFAWEMNSIEDLESLYLKLQREHVEILDIGDHGISLGIYFADPDGNQIEMFYELPKEEWPEGEIFSGNFPYKFKV